MPTEHKRKRKRVSASHSQMEVDRQQIRHSSARTERRGSSVTKKRVLKTRAEYLNQEKKLKSRSWPYKWLSRCYSVLFYGITIGIIVLLLMFCFHATSKVSFFGYRFYPVMANSTALQGKGLSDGGNRGDSLLVKEVAGHKLKSGDIVVVTEDDGSYLTQPIVEKRKGLNEGSDSYLFIADNQAERLIEEERVAGKVVVAIPKVGGVIEFIRKELIICSVLLLFFYGGLLVLKINLASSK